MGSSQRSSALTSSTAGRFSKRRRWKVIPIGLSNESRSQRIVSRVPQTCPAVGALRLAREDRMVRSYQLPWPHGCPKRRRVRWLEPPWPSSRTRRRVLKNICSVLLWLRANRFLALERSDDSIFENIDQSCVRVGRIQLNRKHLVFIIRCMDSDPARSQRNALDLAPTNELRSEHFVSAVQPVGGIEGDFPTRLPCSDRVRNEPVCQERRLDKQHHPLHHRQFLMTPN